MPACLSSENMYKTWPSNESIHVPSASSSSGVQSPCSSISLSPISTSPDNTLRRQRLRKCSLNGNVVQEPFIIRSDCRDSRSQSPETVPTTESFGWLSYIIGWYPCFLIRLVKIFLFAVLPKTSWKELIITIPMLIVKTWIWLLMKIFGFPLMILRFLLSFIFSSDAMEMSGHKRRTILISGGSTIQALHLARNFYTAGARVIVCEIEGVFALTRFSTAVSRFYTLPKPTSVQQENYIQALCEIVDKEQVVYYVPVSSTTSAYYDALAKPHLELLGCLSFCPGIKEVWALDDTLEVLKRCQKFNMPTPPFRVVTSMDDIYSLYDRDVLRTSRSIMTTTGSNGLRDRKKYVLPLNRAELKLPGEINEQKPWVVVQDIEGEHYFTCTTVKDSRVIANVTCRMMQDHSGLVPVEKKEIDQWLDKFFSKLNLLRSVTGHISFRLVLAKDSCVLVPLSSKVGVSLPYICYTSVHPRLLCKPCKHFKRQNSGPLINEKGSYWMSQTVLNTIRNPNIDAVTRLIGTVLDKREALFVVWDPLPYCAYYHMLLPFRNVLGLIRRRQDTFNIPITTPVI